MHTEYLSYQYTLASATCLQLALGMGNDSEAVYHKGGAVRGLKRAPCNTTDRFGPT
jgi:hypothetical protein